MWEKREREKKREREREQSAILINCNKRDTRKI